MAALLFPPADLHCLPVDVSVLYAWAMFSFPPTLRFLLLLCLSISLPFFWIRLIPLAIFFFSKAYLLMILRTLFLQCGHALPSFVFSTHSQSPVCRSLLSCFCLHLRPGDSYQCFPSIHYWPLGDLKFLILSGHMISCSCFVHIRRFSFVPLPAFVFTQPQGGDY